MEEKTNRQLIEGEIPNLLAQQTYKDIDNKIKNRKPGFFEAHELYRSRRLGLSCMEVFETLNGMVREGRLRIENLQYGVVVEDE